MIKRTLFAGIAFAVLLGGMLFSFQQQPPERPPGVTAADWIPLSEKAGVLLTRKRKLLIDPDSRVLQGILYVKVANAWHRMVLDSGPTSIIPAR